MQPSEYTRDKFERKINRWGWEIGEYTYGEPSVLSFSGGSLRIGRFCSIAHGVEIIMYGGDHHPQSPTTFPLDGHRPIRRPDESGARSFRVNIGNDVWLGHGCTIMPDITIGDGAIVGARAVVTSDVEPYAIVAGNPARVIRKRFTDEQIGALLDIRWWDWPIEKVDQFGALLLGLDIDAFIAAAKAASA